MKNLYKIIIIGLSILTLSSCFRLDSLMFDNVEVSEYKLDAYDGDIDFVLDESYKIPSDKITEFTLSSGANADKIYAIYIGDVTTINKDTVIMYCHGNFGHMDYYWQRAKLLANVGGKMRYGVLMIDYKGYGRSEGVSTEGGLVEDVNTALTWLKEKGLNSNRLIMYGFSMGTYPAVCLSGACEGVLSPSKLITEAPFASTDVMASDGSSLAMPASFFMNTHYSNADNIQEVNVPYLWIHGTDDRFLAMKTHGEVVYKNYSGIYAQAERVVGADHGTVPQVMGIIDYMNVMAAFFAR